MKPTSLFSLITSLVMIFQALNGQEQTPDSISYKSVDTVKANELIQEAKQLQDSSYFGQALPLLDKAIEILTAQDTSGSLREAEAWFRKGVSLGELGKYDKAQKATLRCLSIQRTKLPVLHKDLITTLTYLGNLEIPQSMYSEAVLYLEEALLIARLHYPEESREVANKLYLLGFSLLFTENYERSLSMLEKCLAIQQKILPPFHKDFSNTFRSLGSWYSRQTKYETALVYLIKGLENIKHNTTQFNVNIPILCSEIGQICIELKDYANAKEYFDKENTEMINGGQDTTINIRWTIADFAKLYYAENNYIKAIELFSQCIDLFRKASRKENGNIALLFHYLGHCQSSIGFFTQALNSFNEEKRIFSNQFGPDCPDLYLPISDIAQNYRRWFASTGNIDLLETSRLYFDTAQTIILRNLQNENFDLKKKSLLSKIKPIIEQSIKVDLLCTNEIQNHSLLEKAWQKSETMHSFLLNASIEESNAKAFSGIPDSLLKAELNIRKKITEFDKTRQSLIDRKGLSLTDSAVLNINTRLFAAREEYHQIISSLEINYPEYYQLKYNLKNTSITEIQRLLSPAQTIVEYFTGDSSIFIFVINQNQSKLIAVRLDFPLNTWTGQFRNGISGYYESEAKSSTLYKTTLTDYAQASLSLYQKLIAPIASFLSSEVIFIPDGQLNNISFDALISSVPEDLSNFKTYPFLVSNHTISYAYSATMYAHMKNKIHLRTPENDLLAFAPFYLNDSDKLIAQASRSWINNEDLKSLPYSGEEVIQAKRNIGGRSQIYVGANATREKFSTMASVYRILHLGTHAKANEKQGEFSFIAFAPAKDTDNNNLLFHSDLYNLSLNADLVTLSACETGTGELLEGEGMVSMASAFAFAGAKSIVTSLWSVNDQSTMQLMSQFYKELNQGQSKNIALAKAKRSYLKAHPGITAHPYYWAAFIEIGDVSALK
ncbi:MAG: CHAT domain-containing tetratricopeptide repeat protein [Saprospiraceae bacterium]